MAQNSYLQNKIFATRTISRFFSRTIKIRGLIILPITKSVVFFPQKAIFTFWRHATIWNFCQKMTENVTFLENQEEWKFFKTTSKFISDLLQSHNALWQNVVSGYCFWIKSNHIWTPSLPNRVLSNHPCPSVVCRLSLDSSEIAH